MHRDQMSERQLLGLILDRLAGIDGLLGLVHEHQHVIIRRIIEMSATVGSKIAEVLSALGDLSTDIATEMQQLKDAIAAQGTLSTGDAAAFDDLISRIRGMSTTLKSDDPTAPPVNVDPAAFAAAIQSARDAGATDVQLQVIVALGDGVSPQISKAMLAGAIATALVSASDGSAPASAAQLAALSALAA